MRGPAIGGSFTGAICRETVAGAEVSDGTSRTVAVLATNPDNGVADAMLTVTRTVPVGDGDGFVDGASVAWSVSLVTETTCLSGAGTCPVTFEVTRCPAAGEDLSDGAVTEWERRVFVDLTPPTITSLRIASSANPELGAVVRELEKLGAPDELVDVARREQPLEAALPP